MYPLNRKQFLPSIPQDEAAIEANQANLLAHRAKREGLNKSHSELDLEKHDTPDNSLVRKTPPLWINPLFLSSLKNEILPKIPYGISLLVTSFLGMMLPFIVPPIVPAFKQLPNASAAFMRVMKPDEYPPGMFANKSETLQVNERFKRRERASLPRLLDSNSKIQQQAKNLRHEAEASKELIRHQSEAGHSPLSPAEQMLMNEFMADKERMALLCEKIIELSHNLQKILGKSGVSVGPSGLDIGVTGFVGMQKDFDMHNSLPGPRRPTTSREFDRVVGRPQPSKSLKPIAQLGLYIRMSLFRLGRP